MVDHESADHGSTGEEAAAAPVKRPRGHRPSDTRDMVAEMTARAHAISQEAGTRMAQAMKDVINSAAGLTGFAVESARDLLQYMVRRGQMTQSEADRVLRGAEEAHAARQGGGGSAAPRATAGAATPRSQPSRSEPAQSPPSARSKRARTRAPEATPSTPDSPVSSSTAQRAGATPAASSGGAQRGAARSAPSRTSTSSAARPKKTAKGKSSATRPPAARATAPKKGKKK